MNQKHRLVVKSLYEKNVEYFINDIEIIEDNIVIVDNQQDIICCFIGNLELLGEGSKIASVLDLSFVLK